METRSVSIMTENSEPTALEKAQAFLATAEHFRLGHLPTESQHPRTTRLSQMASADLPAAIELLKSVELEALNCFKAQMPRIEELARDMKSVVASGGRIFFCGCGATGRLSLSLETLWREEVAKSERKDLQERVLSFMAGGDYALVKSIENFEDRVDYGAKQLHDLGYKAGDILIGTSEGGETPFVIAAVEEAAKISAVANGRQPYFIYCNPTQLLAKTVERSKNIIDNGSVKSFALETGPMAVSGSTRLQATTVLMLGAGAALFSVLQGSPQEKITEFITVLNQTSLNGLSPLIARESEIYGKNEICVHVTTDYGMTLLTDTTERSPTFSLLAFENALEPRAALAWTYLVIDSAKNSEEAWTKILGRAPRPLDWPGFREKYGQENLKGFDFSPNTLKRRSARVDAAHLHVYEIERTEKEIQISFDELAFSLPRPSSLLCEHLLLKCALNFSSTLLMGRLGRFRGNLMLYVRAANNKLIDRAIRYVQILLKDAGVQEFDYDEICRALFGVVESLPTDQPAVLKTFEFLMGQSHLAGRSAGRSESQTES